MNTHLSAQFGIIKVSGNDAKDFLQAQLSNDISLVSQGTSQISSYNSPKGRVYATFRIIQTDDAYLLITTQDQIVFLVKRLSMFVMRSDVSVTNCSSLYTLYGAAENVIRKLGIEIEENENSVSQHNDMLAVQVLDSTNKRFIAKKATNSPKPHTIYLLK